ncbi:Serpin B10, partial [Toxocara canis]
VQIPKFKLEQQLQLNSALQQMGIYDAFVTRLANFSGISDKALYISDFVHKAFVEVAEEGTEAAAASAIILTRRARPQIQTPPVMFIANHPFMFAIVKDENVLFIGRLF